MTKRKNFVFSLSPCGVDCNILADHGAEKSGLESHKRHRLKGRRILKSHILIRAMQSGLRSVARNLVDQEGGTPGGCGWTYPSPTLPCWSGPGGRSDGSL